jgi:hypothetical protein
VKRPFHALVAALGALSFSLCIASARADVAAQIARDREDFIIAHGDRPIAAIRIEGLSRTRPAVVEQWIDCTAGQMLSTCDLSEARERIYRLGIFAEVDVAMIDRDAGVEVVVTIDEKWTLYPVPVLWYSPGTEMAGVILVEANALGYNKGVAIGGVTSNRGWYTIAGYNDPNIGFTNLWGQIHCFFGSGIVEDDAPDGSIEEYFHMRRFDTEYALGWTFWDRVSPTWTGALRTAHITSIENPGSQLPADATVGLQGFQVIYSDRRFRDLYDEGLRASAEVQHAFSLDRVTPPYNDAIFDVRFSTPAPLHGFWDVRARSFIGALPAAFEERLGGLDNSRTIPGSGLVGVDKFGNFGLAYQVPIFSIKPGTMSTQVFGEIGRYVRNDEPPVTYGGPGIGLRFYLKQVAIPAVGVDVGYEVGSKRVAFSVAIGYRPLR